MIKEYGDNMEESKVEITVYSRVCTRKRGIL